MKCSGIDYLRYLDGRGGTRERGEVRVHVETCASCRRELAKAERLVTLLKAHRRREVDPCPGNERLVALAFGELGRQAGRDVSAHADHCRECARKLRLLGAFARTEIAAVPAGGPAVPVHVKEAIRAARRARLRDRLEAAVAAAIQGGRTSAKRIAAAVGELLNPVACQVAPAAKKDLAGRKRKRSGNTTVVKRGQAHGRSKRG